MDTKSRNIKRSILAKAREEGLNPGEGKLLPPVNDVEKALMLSLTSFGTVALQAFEELAPHRLCAYIYDVANALNSFYHETRILGLEDKEQQSSLLKLLDLTQKVLERAYGCWDFHRLKECRRQHV